MSMGTSNFGELLWPGIKSTWGDTYNQWPELYSKFFDVVTSDKSFEKYQGLTGFGPAAVKDQGDSISYVNAYEGYQKQITNVTYGLGAQITWELYEDDQYNFINTIPKKLARSLRETEEIVAHSVLNNAFTAGTYAGADGVALCSTAHPLVAPTDATTTFANTPTVTADLSQAAVEDALITISNLVDDRGLKQNMKGKQLIVPTASQFIAQKILKTEFEVDTNNNTVNPVRGLLVPIVTPYLTDSDSWFITTDCSDDGLVFQRRAGAKIDKDGAFDTLNMKFITYSRFGVSFVNPRCIYGSAGA